MPFIWVKRTMDKEGKIIADYDKTSKWTRENTEVCLLATKGTLQRVNDNVPQVTACSSEKDYLKPEYFKQLTVQLLGDLPALELFPDPRREERFNTTYNGINIVWDLAITDDYLEFIEEQQDLQTRINYALFNQE